MHAVGRSGEWEAWHVRSFGLSSRGSLPRGLWIAFTDTVNWDEDVHTFLLTSNWNIPFPSNMNAGSQPYSISNFFNFITNSYQVFYGPLQCSRYLKIAFMLINNSKWQLLSDIPPDLATACENKEARWLILHHQVVYSLYWQLYLNRVEMFCCPVYFILCI